MEAAPTLADCLKRVKKTEMPYPYRTSDVIEFLADAAGTTDRFWLSAFVNDNYGWVSGGDAPVVIGGGAACNCSVGLTGSELVVGEGDELVVADGALAFDAAEASLEAEIVGIRIWPPRLPRPPWCRCRRRCRPQCPPTQTAPESEEPSPDGDLGGTDVSPASPPSDWPGADDPSVFPLQPATGRQRPFRSGHKLEGDPDPLGHMEDMYDEAWGDVFAVDYERLKAWAQCLTWLLSAMFNHQRSVYLDYFRQAGDDLSDADQDVLDIMDEKALLFSSDEFMDLFKGLIYRWSMHGGSIRSYIGYGYKADTEEIAGLTDLLTQLAKCSVEFADVINDLSDDIDSNPTLNPSDRTKLYALVKALDKATARAFQPPPARDPGGA